MDVRSGLCRRLISTKWVLLGIIVSEKFSMLSGAKALSLCFFYCNTMSASLLVEQRKLIFYNKILRSSNIVLRMLYTAMRLKNFHLLITFCLDTQETWTSKRPFGHVLSGYLLFNYLWYDFAAFLFVCVCLFLECSLPFLQFGVLCMFMLCAFLVFYFCAASHGVVMYAVWHIRPHSLCAGPSLSLTRQSPQLSLVALACLPP